MKASKLKRPAAARRQRRRGGAFVPKKDSIIIADSEGGLPLPAEMSRDLNIRIGDDYAFWKHRDGWKIVFSKGASSKVKIPKHAEWRKVEPALPDEPVHIFVIPNPPLTRAKPVRKKPNPPSTPVDYKAALKSLTAISPVKFPKRK